MNKFSLEDIFSFDENKLNFMIEYKYNRRENYSPLKERNFTILEKRNILILLIYNNQDLIEDDIKYIKSEFYDKNNTIVSVDYLKNSINKKIQKSTEEKIKLFMTYNIIKRSSDKRFSPLIMKNILSSTFSWKTPKLSKILNEYSHFAPILSLAMNEKFIVSASIDSTINVWKIYNINNVPTFEFMKNLLHPSSIYCVAINNDYIVSGLENCTIKVWKIEQNDTFKLIKTFRDHEGTIMSVAISNQYIVSGSSDRTVKVWKICNNNFELLISLQAHNNIVYSVGISKVLNIEKYYIVSGSADKTVKVWEMEDTTFSLIGILAQHTNIVTSVAIGNFNNTQYIISGSIDKTIKIWKFNDNNFNCILSLNNNDEIAYVMFNKNYLVSCFDSYTKSIKIWQIVGDKFNLISTFSTKSKYTNSILMNDNFMITSSGDENYMSYWVKG